MEFWLLAGMALWLVYVYAAAAIHLPAENIRDRAAGRDLAVSRGLYAGRAERARANYQENLPFFMGLGLMSLVVAGTDIGIATTGAAVFVLARVAYLACYIAAIPLTRSIAYTVSMAGLVMMAWGVVSGL